MKKLKRLAAVLLAGIMALALLTACSGSDAGNPEFEANVEGVYQEALKTKFEKELENGGAFTNDADIKALAIEHIEEKHDAKSLTKETIWKTDGDVKTVVRQVLLCYTSANGTLVPRFYEAATAQNITPDVIDLLTLHNAVKTLKTKAEEEGMTLELTALGVGAKTFGGKTYIAIGFELTNTTPQN